MTTMIVCVEGLQVLRSKKRKREWEIKFIHIIIISNFILIKKAQVIERQAQVQRRDTSNKTRSLKTKDASDMSTTIIDGKRAISLHNFGKFTAQQLLLQQQHHHPNHHPKQKDTSNSSSNHHQNTQSQTTTANTVIIKSILILYPHLHLTINTTHSV